MNTQKKQNACKPVLGKGMTAPVQEGETAIVVGAALSGEAAAKLLATLGAKVKVLDVNPAAIRPEFADYAKDHNIEIITGPHAADHFVGATLVVTSPGVPLARLEPFLAAAGNPVLLSELELALRYVQEPVLAVTGTSGKTTTVSLAAAMLEAAGKKVFLGGNIGIPLSDYVLNPDKADVLVLEVSSFQLQCTGSLHPKAAILLNLSENHLDQHKDMAEYTEAKFSIFARQTSEDIAILPPALQSEYQRRGYKGKLTLLKQDQCFANMRLHGKHNACNAEAAWLAVSCFGVSHAEAACAVESFEPLRHRLELAAEKDGVLYINDSKCTTVDALAAALSSFDRPVILLAGGKFKGGDLESLLPLLKGKVKKVILFGASREVFEEAWKSSIPLSWCPILDDALEQAKAEARPGDVVLLSPATASYDLYKNYMHRGDHFCKLVAEL